MNKLRCYLFAAIVVISTATLGSGGVIQGPGKSDPTPTPTPSSLTTESTDGLNPQPTSTGEVQTIWQDATTMMVEILLTVF